MFFVPSRRFWSPRVNNDSGFTNASLNINVNTFLRQNLEQNDSGNQIADLFCSIEENDELYARALRLIRCVFPEFASFSTRFEDTKDLVYRTTDGIEHRTDFLGDGIISVMRIIAYLICNKDELIVIDEPELSLHPVAQKRLAKLLYDESKTKQIVLSTHSPHFVNWEYFANGAVLNKITKTDAEGSKIYSIRNFTEFSSLLSIDWQKPFKLDLVAKEIFFQDNILFLEGQEDVSFLSKEFEDSNVNIFGYGANGFPSFEMYLKFAEALGVKKAAVIIDNGVDETNYKEEKLDGKFGTYEIIQWNKNDIRDKYGEDEVTLKKSGYFDSSGVKKPEAELDDFYDKIRMLKDYFNN